MRIFRESLTALAALLAIALLALVVAPPFMDWNGQRGRVTAFLSSALDIEVRIAGDLRLTLLPSPELDAERVEIGPVDRPVVSAERMTVSLSPAALLAGTIRVSSARVDRAVIAMAALRSVLSRGAANPAFQRSGIDRLDIRGATLLRAGQLAPVPDDPLAGLDIRFEAPSLLGPYRVEMSDPLRSRDFRAQIGRIEDSRARTKGVYEDKFGATRASLEGWLTVPAEGGTPGFDGSVQFNGNPLIGGSERGVQLPFDGSARLILGAQQIILDPVNIGIGSGEQALQLTGQGFVDLAAARPVAQLRLNAKRLDLTALTTTPPGKPARVIDWFGASTFVHTAPELRLPFDLGLSVAIDAVQLPEGVLQEGRFALAIGARGLTVDSFSLRLPGAGEATYARAERAGAAVLDGRFDIESRDPATLLAFIRGGPTSAGVPAALKMSSGVLSTSGGIELPGMFFASSAGAMSGSGMLLWPEPGKRSEPRVQLELSASRFDARVLAALDPLRPLKGLDVGTRLTVGALVVDGAEIGGLDVALDRDGALASLRQFRLRGRKGEELTLSGSASGDALQLVGKLDAETLGDISRLANALLPGPLTDGFIRRAAALEPAIGVGNIRIENRGGEVIWDIVAEGRLGGTKLNAKTHSVVRDNDLRVSLDGEISNEDGARLLAQITGAALSGRPSLPGKLVIKAEGNPRRAINGTLAGAVAGIDLNIAANFNPFRQQNLIDGQIRLETGDLGVLHAALGGGSPAIAPGTRAQLRARIFGDASKVTLSGLSAEFGAVPVSGEISFDLMRAGQMAGQIRVKSLGLALLLAPATGKGVAIPERLEWSQAPFAAALPMLLSGDLWVEAERLEVSPSLSLEGARFVLRFSPDQVAFEGFEARLGATVYSGALSLARRGAKVDATGRLALARGSIPGLSGRISGEVPFSSGGDSLFEIVSNLGGAGRLQFEAVVIPEADLRALPRVASRPPDSFPAIDENRIGAALEAELKAAPLNLPTINLPITMLNGQLRLGGSPLELDRQPVPGVLITPSLLLDLPRAFLDAKLNIRMNSMPKGWRGASPEIAIGWAGRIPEAANRGGVRRQLQVASLVNGFLAMAIQRDLERAEAFEADVRERAWFLRRQRADRFLQRRELEMLAFEKAREEAEAAAKLREIIQDGAIAPAPQPPRAVP